MGDYYEGRSRACWICKYFMQYDDTYRNGICARFAPDKIDENNGAGPPGFAMFSNVNDSLTAFCGDFAPYEVAPPSVVPPIQPPA